MKWAIGILMLCGFAGLFAAATGIQTVRGSTAASFDITYHSLGGRAIALVFGIVALSAAWACRKRKMFGWYAVAGLLWCSLLSAIIRTVYLTFTVDLPVPALLLGALGEAAKIALLYWLTLRYWPKLRREF